MAIVTQLYFGFIFVVEIIQVANILVGSKFALVVAFMPLDFIIKTNIAITRINFANLSFLLYLPNKTMIIFNNLKGLIKNES